MVRAYVLVKIEAGRAKEILERLRAIDAVAQADAVTGPVDLIVQVEASDPRALAELIFRSIQTVSGVKETDTRIVIED
jgi:DNA-binding Lrp family transcriptional regulator